VIATSTVKSNYPWFATIMLNFVRNKLSHTVDIGLHTIGVITWGSYNIALYTVLQSEVYGDILLLSVRVRHIENAQIVIAYTSK